MGYRQRRLICPAQDLAAAPTTNDPLSEILCDFHRRRLYRIPSHLKVLDSQDVLYIPPSAYNTFSLGNAQNKEDVKLNNVKLFNISREFLYLDAF